MDLIKQHALLGLMTLKKHKFNVKTAELITLQTEKPKKIMHIGGKYIYRFSLKYSERIDAPINEFAYLMYYGIFNPLAKILHNDGDVFNNLKNNLTATAQENEIALDTKDKIHKLFADGKGYAEIGRKLHVGRQTVKQICAKYYNHPHPHRFRRLDKLLDSFNPPNYSKK